MVDEPRGGFNVMPSTAKPEMSAATPPCRTSEAEDCSVSEPQLGQEAVEPANKFLAGKGFARIDFTGPVPGDVGWSSTSVFSQDLLPWTQRAELPGSRTRTIVKR